MNIDYTHIYVYTVYIYTNTHSFTVLQLLSVSSQNSATNAFRGSSNFACAKIHALPHKPFALVALYSFAMAHAEWSHGWPNSLFIQSVLREKMLWYETHTHTHHSHNQTISESNMLKNDS